MENSFAAPRKSTPLGGKIWTNALLFGLIGQIAWVVENMYFATFAQKLFAETSKFGNMYYTATTLMVIFSAITATVTTIFMGGLCDKVGKRKPFITIGYIFWGATIMLFAAIPIDFTSSEGGLIIALLVIFDCIMTFAGSTANDAAFNAWVADVTDVTNRGKVNTILSIMPVLATVVTIVIAMFTFDQGNYTIFFIVLGVIPMVTGVLSTFLLKDAPGIVKSSNPNYLKETFYGFRPSVIKSNKMMYVALSALCLIGIAQQTFMSYLISFVTVTLGITDYLVPLAVIIVVSAIITGVMGVLFDKFGRKNFYIPLVGIIGFHAVHCGRADGGVSGLYPQRLRRQIPGRENVFHGAYPDDYRSDNLADNRHEFLRRHGQLGYASPVQHLPCRGGGCPACHNTRHLRA